MILKVRFKHPEYEIPCCGEYNEDSKTLIIDIVDYEEAESIYPDHEVEEVRQWCMQNSINCYSTNQGNRHLDYLGIHERLDVVQ